MRCARCRTENPSNAKFCVECAAPLVRTCTRCNAQLPPGAKFCPECAHPAADPGAAQSRFGSPETYTPKHLAEKILTSRGALEGERKQVTVLFADLKGSMELLAERDPEEVRNILDPVLDRLMDAVHRYEGTVNQVMGDGIMALFGAPVAHEDHATRACYAALRMQETVNRYADGVRQNEGITIQIRVGLNSGEVVVRSIGSDLRMDYTAVGQTTNLAARMEQLATPGSILITADTLRLAEDYVEVRPLGPVSVKGIGEPRDVFEVVGAASVRPRLRGGAGRGLTRFVGRDVELDQLRQGLERAAAGHGQVIAVVGEPGVGKSRLYWEFTRSHRTQGWLILESLSVSYGKATPYLPVVDLLRAYFQIEAQDTPRRILEKVTGKLLSLDRALEPDVSALLWLLDVPIDDVQWQSLDRSQRRQRTLDGLKRLLLRESQVQPLLVLFEDLHWIDAETQALLDSLVESVPTSRLLLLVNYRPEYQHSWAGKSYYLQLRIDPLPPETAEKLLGAMLGEHESLTPLKSVLIRRTEGNPLFLEQTVRTLVETKVLTGDRGAYRLAKPLQELEIPPSVQAILAARIDRLAPEDKRLLQAASVIGMDVPLGLLNVIADEGEDSVRQGLARLQAAEFLYEARLFPDLEYTFHHALTHHVAYGSLVQDRRRVLHSRIVEAIESQHPGRLIEHVERLGHHAFRGESWEKAVSYLRQAGVKAYDRSANQDAIACFEQALAALKHLPQRAETFERAIDLRFDLRSPLFALGEFRRTLDHLDEAEKLAVTLDDQLRLGRIAAYKTNSIWRMGDNARALESGRHLLAIATAQNDFTLQVMANHFLGQIHSSLGDYRQGAAFERKNVETLHGELLHERFGMVGPVSAFSRAFLVHCLAETGEFGEGITRGEEAVRVAEEVNHPVTLIEVYWALGSLYLQKGDFAKAIPVLERGVACAENANIMGWFPWVASSLGLAYARSGRLAEALALLERAVGHAESINILAYHSLAVMRLAEARLLAQQRDEALDLAQRALRLSRERSERGVEAWTLRLLGELRSATGASGVGDAADAYSQAMALASELGMRPLIAHCHLGLAGLHARARRDAQGREHLTSAMRMLREMDMQFWLEKAGAETERQT